MFFKKGKSEILQLLGSRWPLGRRLKQKIVIKTVPFGSQMAD